MNELLVNKGETAKYPVPTPLHPNDYCLNSQPVEGRADLLAAAGIRTGATIVGMIDEYMQILILLCTAD
ncbi:hypothetical protein ACFQAT_23475 [Undibacterium arcticum]|uniref:Uncharacterized protein n=1 Tax=Undibacterium arcticum TaxID=1762892 RepID=A0ABV7F6H4_9BURK